MTFFIISLTQRPEAISRSKTSLQVPALPFQDGILTLAIAVFDFIGAGPPNSWRKNRSPALTAFSAAIA